MLILASQSATRKTLLENAKIAFSAEPAAIDERAMERRALDSGADSQALARALANAKAQAVSRRLPKAWVLGADQTLSHGALLLHKPETREEALEQWMALRGTTHTLHAAVALAYGDEIVFSHCESAHLTMRAFTRDQAQTVLAAEGDAVLGSVGGYRLEGPSVRLFARVEGDYFTVLGLPLLATIGALNQWAPELLEAHA